MNSKRTWPVLLLFFCSGATALIYEVVWSKYLSQMFGSTIYAQTVVLAVFMGGLALGNRWFGAKSQNLARPVRTYGFIELAIGLYAFFFPNLFSVADKIFVQVGSAMLEHSLVLLAIKGSLSLALAHRAHHFDGRHTAAPRRFSGTHVDWTQAADPPASIPSTVWAPSSVPPSPDSISCKSGAWSRRCNSARS